MKRIRPGKAFIAVLLYPLIQACFFYLLGMWPHTSQFIWATGYFWFSAVLAIAASEWIRSKALRWTVMTSVFAFLLAGISFIVRSQVTHMGGWITFELWMCFGLTWLACILAEAVAPKAMGSPVPAQAIRQVD